MKKNHIKTIIRYIIFSVLITFFALSCKNSLDNSLNIEPRNQLTDASVWANSTTADIFLNDIYGRLFDGNNCWDILDNWTDISMCGLFWPPSKTSTVYNHEYNATNGFEMRTGYTDGTTEPFEWGHQYSFIRKCNIFIASVNANAANFSADWMKTRLAETRFLRAFFYNNLYMAYGGVPILTEALNLNSQGDSIFHPRNTADQTYNFITTELGAIANDLPNTASDYGRITKGAALTLKGYVELFNHKYADASVDNKAVIDLGVYSLYPDYANLFLPAGINNNEGILFRLYLPPALGGRESLRGPCFNNEGVEVCWGGVNPSQQLVDDYAMANGKPITDPLSGYNPQNPYNNRETRFYKSIVQDSSLFGNETLYTRIGIGSLNELDVNERSDASNTGYMLRKGTSPDNIGAQNWNNGTSSENYYFFRYAEVLLNYAEAKIEANSIDQSVYDAIDKVRQRSELPTVETSYGTGLSQESMRSIVRRERKVELAFENKRWWDLIRWRTAEVEINKPIMAMKITKNANGQWVYTSVPAINGNHKFDASKNYLFPIWQSIIDQNPKITQNPGY